MEHSKKNNQNKNSKGFYIAVCCCVAVIGITGYITNKSKNSVSDTPLPGPTQKVARLSPTPQPEKASKKNDSTPAPTKTAEVIKPIVPSNQEPEIETMNINEGTIDASEIQEPDEDNIEASVTVNSDPTFIMPVDGEIADVFSGDKLVFNNAMGDWRTHNGIDIITDSDTQVLAAADGLIKDIYDDYYGKTVLISHSNGFETLYASLKNTDGIEIGQAVKQGEKLAPVSEVCTGENITNPHLHFEIIKQGNPVNPEDIIGA